MRNLSVGVRRLFPTGSNISYRFLDGRGEYQNRIPGVSLSPTAFEQREHQVRVSWSATGKTTVTATIGHVQREHAGLSVRDFSGVRGNVGVQWSATGKTGVQVTLSREISPYQTNTASYTTANRLAMYPYWSVSSRTVLYAGLDHSRQSFDGALPGAIDDERADRSTGASLGMRWKPMNALQFSAALGHERRNSNINGFNYTNRSARLDAKFAF